MPLEALSVVALLLTQASGQPSPPAGPNPGATQPAPEAIYMYSLEGQLPSGLAYLPNGTLLVAGGRYGVDAVSSDGKVLRREPAKGSVTDPEVLSEATAITMLQQAAFAIADAAGDRVVLFDQFGKRTAELGGPGVMRHPSALCATSARLAVADTGNDRVLVYSMNDLKAPPLVIGRRGPAVGEFRAPLGVAFDGDGRLYVADSDNNRIQRFAPDGVFEAAFGTRGAMPGQFERPMGLVWDKGTLLVVDHYNHRIQRVRADGAFISMWGMHAVRPREGEGRIHYPVALAVDPFRGNIAVAEPFERRVQVFRKSKPDERVPASPPLPAKQGVSSHFGDGISVDGQTLAVWEPESASVIIFDLRDETPVHVTTFGGPGVRHHQFGRIAAVCVDDANDRVWVADTGTDRLSEWLLVRDRAAPLKYEPFMARLLRTWDLSAIAAALAKEGRGPARIEPLALSAGLGPYELILLDGARNAPLGLSFDAYKQLRATPIPIHEQAPRRLQAIARSPQRDRLFLLNGADTGPLGVIVNADGGAPTSIERPPGMVAPQSAAWLAGGQLVITDASDRFWIVSQDGRVLDAPLHHGIDDGDLWHPRGVAADGRGDFYVVDWGNHRIQRFGADGEWQARFSLGRPSVRPRLPDATPPQPTAAPPGTKPAAKILPPASPNGPWPRTITDPEGRFTLTWRPVDDAGKPLAAIPSRKPFSIAVQLAGPGLKHLVDPPYLQVDASMPHHGHGMNLAPKVTPHPHDHSYRVEPMLFHMPGLWEMYFDLNLHGSPGYSVREVVRLQDSVDLEGAAP